MNSKRKVIIDCDPGIDDSLALIFALLSPELEICGITTVCGNVPSDMGAENVLKVLKLMNRLDIPVYIGEEKPLVKALVTAQDTHGTDGLGESGYAPVKEMKAKPGAVDFMIKSLKTHPGIAFIALGPLTNIAKALMQCPKAFENLSELVSMGGSYKSHGNCSPVAEFNYWADPDSAKYVYETLHRPISMVGLDVTRQIVLTPDLLSLIGRFDSPVGRFITDVTKFYVDFHWQQEKILGCVINDPLAVAYFVDRSLCRGIEAYVTVETTGICAGQSVVDAYRIWQKPANCTVMVDTQAEAFMKLFLDRLFPDKAPLMEQMREAKSL